MLEMKKILIVFFSIIICATFSVVTYANDYIDFNTTLSNVTIVDVSDNSRIFNDEEIVYVNFGAGLIRAKQTYVSTTNTVQGVSAFLILEDYSNSILDNMNSVYDTNFPAAIRLSSATAYFNCHSYAWHSREIETNQYWINDPTLFYEDNSYCSVSNPQIGDIISYYYISSQGELIITHSGVVTSIIDGESNSLCGNSDLVMVTSKWGMAGLYNHNGYECPYTLFKPNFINSSEIATTVRYYRGHDYANYQQSSSGKHTATCMECGYIGSLLHHFTFEQTNARHHTCRCIDCGYEKTELHTWNTNMTKCTKCGFSPEGSLLRYLTYIDTSE